MRLYLVQHGEAHREEEDPERRLTDQGATDVQRTARMAAGSNVVSAPRIFHSGKTRARQTAEAWGEALGVGVDSAEELAPLDDPGLWAKRVADEQDDIMLVGHLPHLARLAGLLLAGDPDRSVVSFQQGALIGLERGENGWSVFLVLPPGMASPVV